MEFDKVQLCPFCAGLVNWQTPSQRVPPFRLPHHPTFGILVASGRTCRVCGFIASLWEFNEGHLTRFSNETNPAVRNTRESFGLSIGVKESGYMGSGLHWTLLEVTFISNATRFRVLSWFSLATCGAQGKMPSLI